MNNDLDPRRRKTPGDRILLRSHWLIRASRVGESCLGSHVAVERTSTFQYARI